MVQGNFNTDGDDMSREGVVGCRLGVVNSESQSTQNSNPDHGQSAANYPPPRLSLPSSSTEAFQQRPVSNTLQYPQTQSVAPVFAASPSQQSWNSQHNPSLYPPAARSPTWSRLSTSNGAASSSYPRCYVNDRVFQSGPSVEHSINPQVSRSAFSSHFQVPSSHYPPNDFPFFPQPQDGNNDMHGMPVPVQPQYSTSQAVSAGFPTIDQDALFVNSHPPSSFEVVSTDLEGRVYDEDTQYFNGHNNGLLPTPYLSDGPTDS
jgi:hypothetical protein